LVIGGSGFTGQRVLSGAPSSWAVGALARSAAAEEVVAQLGATPLRGDLDHQDSLLRAAKQWEPDAVICTASLGFGHAEPILEALSAAGCPRTVFTSTTGIFTKLNPESKAIRIAAERSIEDSVLPWTILRPTMIYGAPGDRNMERLLASLRRVPFVPAPDAGRTLQQPVYVDDLAGALLAAVVAQSAVGQAINVAGPTPLTFADVVKHAGRAVGRSARVLPLPTGLLRSAASVQEALFTNPRIKREQIDRLLEDKVFDNAAAEALLGFHPRSFEEGINQEAQLLRRSSHEP
jgi:nucleoside-diphosphate-sugar epimerase